MRFTKMQGIGNDYIYISLFQEEVANPEMLARAMSDRHYGIGSDGIVLIGPSVTADFRMRMFNSDGSESEMCGNAARCVGKYVYETGLTDRTSLTIETGGGIRDLFLDVRNGRVQSIRVDMGCPILEPAVIPVKIQGNRAVSVPIDVGGEQYRMTCVSMGNPHAVIFVNDPERFDVERVGKLVERHLLFPARTNTEFASVQDRETIRMRVWERGAGETMACGTGACATLVAAVLNGLCEKTAVLKLNGGNLIVRWDPDTGHVLQEGPAEFVFEGVWPD